MIEIPLTKGKVALIDDEDLPLVNGRKWQATGDHTGYYATASVQCNFIRSFIRMHRVIMQPPPGMVVDHISGNTLDNRRANLRVCTPTQNAANTRKYRGASQYKGVCRQRTKWEASIKVGPTLRHLGTFVNEIDAARAYDAAALEIRGEFARINFPQGEA